MATAKILTPPGVLMHPKLFKPALAYKAKPGDDLYFSTGILFTAEALKTQEWQTMLDAIEEAAVEEWGNKAYRKFVADGGKLITKIRTDCAKKGYPDHFVAWLSNVRTKFDPAKPQFVPQIIGANKAPITDPAEIYNGVRARISISAGAYEGSDGKGVTFYLGNVQKIGNAPRMESAPTADEFGELAPEETADDLAAML